MRRCGLRFRCRHGSRLLFLEVLPVLPPCRVFRLADVALGSLPDPRCQPYLVITGSGYRWRGCMMHHRVRLRAWYVDGFVKAQRGALDAWVTRGC
jgi:hypothetical protein